MRLDFWRRKKEEVIKEEHVSFDELEGYISRQLGKENERIRDDAKRIIEEICRVRGSIALEIKDLEKAGIPKEVPKRAHKAIETAKPHFVKSMLAEIEKLEAGARNYAEIEEFNKKTKEALSSIEQMLLRGRYLPIAFGEQYHRIVAQSKKLLEQSDQLDGLLHSKQARELRKILLEQRYILEKKGEIRKRSAAKTTARENLSGAEKDLKKIEDDIEKITKGMPYLAHKELEKKLKDTQEEVRKTGERIHEGITPLKRQLRMFKRGADRVTEKLIDAYIECPISGMMSDEKNEMDKLLASMKESAGKTLEDDGEKITHRIDAAVNALAKRQDYKKARDLVEKIKQEVSASGVPHAMQRKESEAAGIKNTIAAIETEIKNEGEKIKEAESEIRDKTDALRKYLKERNITLATT